MRNTDVREWIVARLTRRRAWAAIAFLVVWSVVGNGVLVRQMRADGGSIALLAPQLAVSLILLVLVSIWLLRNARRSPK